MLPSEKQLILKSNASQFNVEFDERQTKAAEFAMNDYALRSIDKFRDKQNQAEFKNIGSFFWSLFMGDLMLWKRKRAFLKAKKQAIALADIENRPFYVIRATDTSYVVQSTLVARNLRKRGVYDKKVNAVKLLETADFTAWPKSK